MRHAGPKFMKLCDKNVQNALSTENMSYWMARVSNLISISQMKNFIVAIVCHPLELNCRAWVGDSMTQAYGRSNLQCSTGDLTDVESKAENYVTFWKPLSRCYPTFKYHLPWFRHSLMDNNAWHKSHGIVIDCTLSFCSNCNSLIVWHYVSKYPQFLLQTCLICISVAFATSANEDAISRKLFASSISVISTDTASRSGLVSSNYSFFLNYKFIRVSFGWRSTSLTKSSRQALQR